jgi:uncharacterized protein
MKKYVSRAEKEFGEFCDSYFSYDADVENYCREKHIQTYEDNYLINENTDFLI